MVAVYEATGRRGEALQLAKKLAKNNPKDTSASEAYSSLLLQTNSRPTAEQVKAWMMGNLCRCTGYYKIVESILAAAEAGPVAVVREAVGVR